MEIESEQQKKVAPPSTVSLDSTYDREDGGTEAVEKSPLHKRHPWTPLVVLAGLILVAVGLVLALDRGDPRHQGYVVDEGDLFVSSHAALMSGRSLTGPQNKLVAWLKQMRNASELYVEGGSTNTSVSGLLFPRNGSDTWLPFDAVVTIESGVVLPTRQFVALQNGRGYKWTVTSLGYGDSIVTNDCLASSRATPLNELDKVVSTAKWTSDDPDDKSEVNVVFGGTNYTVSEEEDDYDYGYDLSETDASRCWLVESEEEDFGLRVCIPELRQQFPPEDEFAVLFNATSGCPQLIPSPTHAKAVLVPLPLRKWYASYKSE
ncbi:hypothetical protein PR001_g15167 [Phytophthora rubi]|uniref:Uncharacterized protein n=1 Tax=Phytophthora rubi TaxID=129364 RepID=A0A6A3L5M0_9STRA|nr:hypothetical protein PR001_g15167 [Phytophthora rubi]